MLWPALTYAQGGGNIQKIKTIEAEIQDLAFAMVLSPEDSNRIKANYAFIPRFVEALKVEGSFGYKFDSLPNLSILYPKDSSFRVITWQVSLKTGLYRYYGAIQMNSKQLKLHPFVDRTDSIRTPRDTVMGPEFWYGAFYYNLLETKHKGTAYYSLLGFDGNDLWSHYKVIEVLTFDKKTGKPTLGAPIFDLSADESYIPINITKPITRFLLEYKFDAKVSLNYSADDKAIIFDHLISENEKATDIGFDRLPDGSYDGMKWENGKWTLVPNIYEMTIYRKDPPRPSPVDE